MSVVMMSKFSWLDDELPATNDLKLWNEPALVASAKEGNSEAFGRLCERHEKKIYRVTHRITRNHEDAEDAVQDTFLSAFIHLRDFDGRSQFGTWLTRIGINAALGRLRKKRGSREVPMDEPSPSGGAEPHITVPDHGPNPEESYHLAERKKAVRNAIVELRPRVRKVVEFHHLEENSIRETAKILNISTVAAKSRMFHARIALRRSLVPKIRRPSRSATGGR